MEETPGLAAARLGIHNSRGGCLSIDFSELFNGLTPYNSEELAQAMDEDQSLTSLCIMKSISPPVAVDDDDDNEDEEEDPAELVSFFAFLLDYISDRPHLRKLVSKRRSPMTSDVNSLAMIEIAAAQNASIDELTIVDADLFDEDVTWNSNGYRVITLEHVDLVGKRFPDMDVSHSLSTIPVDRLEMKAICPRNASSAWGFMERASYLKPKVLVVDEDMLDVLSPDLTNLESLSILPSSIGEPLPRSAGQRVLEKLVTNTTLTELHVHSDASFDDKDGLHVLNGYVARNRALRSFFKNPGDFPPPMIASLLEEIDHCTSVKFRMVHTLVSLGYF